MASARARSGRPTRAATVAVLLVMSLSSACVAPVIFGSDGLPRTSGGGVGRGTGAGAPAAPHTATHCEQPSGAEPFQATSPEDVDLDPTAVSAAIGDPAMFTS